MRKGARKIKQLHLRQPQTASSPKAFPSKPRAKTLLHQRPTKAPTKRQLTHTINLCLRCKPALNDLRYFLEFQVPQQWVPMFYVISFCLVIVYSLLALFCGPDLSILLVYSVFAQQFVLPMSISYHWRFLSISWCHELKTIRKVGCYYPFFSFI